MSPYYLRGSPPPWTRRGRQVEMQNWRCCFCDARHAWWFHNRPGKDGGGRQESPTGAVPGAAGDGDGD